MTREEAIKELKIELSMWESDCKSYHKTKEALEMAIKALEQENMLFKSGLLKDCESCKAKQASILDEIRTEIIELRSKQNVGVLECLDIINKYKAGSGVEE